MTLRNPFWGPPTERRPYSATYTSRMRPAAMAWTGAGTGRWSRPARPGRRAGSAPLPSGARRGSSCRGRIGVEDGVRDLARGPLVLEERGDLANGAGRVEPGQPDGDEGGDSTPLVRVQVRRGP